MPCDCWVKCVVARFLSILTEVIGFTFEWQIYCWVQNHKNLKSYRKITRISKCPETSLCCQQIAVILTETVVQCGFKESNLVYRSHKGIKWYKIEKEFNHARIYNQASVMLFNLMGVSLPLSMLTIMHDQTPPFTPNPSFPLANSGSYQQFRASNMIL